MGVQVEAEVFVIEDLGFESVPVRYTLQCVVDKHCFLTRSCPLTGRTIAVIRYEDDCFGSAPEAVKMMAERHYQRGNQLFNLQQEFFPDQNEK